MTPKTAFALAIDKVREDYPDELGERKVLSSGNVQTLLICVASSKSAHTRLQDIYSVTHRAGPASDLARKTHSTEVGPFYTCLEVEARHADGWEDGPHEIRQTDSSDENPEEVSDEIPPILLSDEHADLLSDWTNNRADRAGHALLAMVRTLVPGPNGPPMKFEEGLDFLKVRWVSEHPQTKPRIVFATSSHAVEQRIWRAMARSPHFGGMSGTQVGDDYEIQFKAERRDPLVPILEAHRGLRRKAPEPPKEEWPAQPVVREKATRRALSMVEHMAAILDDYLGEPAYVDVHEVSGLAFGYCGEDASDRLSDIDELFENWPDQDVAYATEDGRAFCGWSLRLLDEKHDEVLAKRPTPTVSDDTSDIEDVMVAIHKAGDVLREVKRTLAPRLEGGRLATEDEYGLAPLREVRYKLLDETMSAVFMRLELGVADLILGITHPQWVCVGRSLGHEKATIGEEVRFTLDQVVEVRDASTGNIFWSRKPS